MKVRTIFAAWTSVVIVGFLASATCQADSFDRQDSNQDGVLSGKEAVGLQVLDQDGDGEVSRQEFQAAAKEQQQRVANVVARIMKERDGNGDGKLSGTEISGLEHCDTNQDRRVTEAELREGLASPDATLKDNSLAQIREIAIERFTLLDINSDGRLTGTEAHGSLHFDQNVDGRVIKEEYIIGLMLSGAGDNAGPMERPKAPADIDKVLSEFSMALNDSTKASLVYERFHKNLKLLVDLPMLEYAFRYAHESHGATELPAKNAIAKSTLENGEIQVETKLRSQRGQLSLYVKALNGTTTSLAIESPEMLTLDRGLFRDLQGDHLQRQFVERYGPDAELALRLIAEGKDDQALDLISPAVIEKIGREPFDNLFQKLRTRVKKIKSVELESFSTDLSEKGIYTFSLTYLVTGDAGSLQYKAIFQRVALKGVMTGIFIHEAKDGGVSLLKPAGPPPPTPSGTDKSKRDGQWVETVSLENGVTFRMPGDVIRGEQEDSPVYSLQLPEKGMSFELLIATVDPTVATNSDLFFKVFKDLLVEKRGAEVLVEKIRTKDDFPEQSLLLKAKSGKIAAIRNVIDGNVNYRATWIGPDLGDDSRSYAIPFVDSIKLIDSKGAPRFGMKPAGQNGSAVPPPAFPPPMPPAPVTPEP